MFFRKFRFFSNYIPLTRMISAQPVRRHSLTNVSDFSPEMHLHRHQCVPDLMLCSHNSIRAADAV